MSDLMLHGVLNMPLPDDPSKIDLVTWVQFKDRATQASSRIEELEAKLEKAVLLLFCAMVQLREGKAKTRRNRADRIEEFLAELKGEQP